MSYCKWKSGDDACNEQWMKSKYEHSTNIENEHDDIDNEHGHEYRNEQ